MPQIKVELLEEPHTYNNRSLDPVNEFEELEKSGRVSAATNYDTGLVELCDPSPLDACRHYLLFKDGIPYLHNVPLSRVDRFLAANVSSATDSEFNGIPLDVSSLHAIIGEDLTHPQSGILYGMIYLS